MKIGIYGSAAGEINEGLKEKARKIGGLIAEKGHMIVTGGCPGLPYEAVLGAYEKGGICIGYSPATNQEKHRDVDNFPIKGFERFVFVPETYEHADDPAMCRKYRNLSSVSTIDAAIIISGRIGTMNEFTIAYDLGKNIGVLEGSGGISDEAIKILLRDAKKKSSSKIIFDPYPETLVEKLIGSTIL